MKALLQKINHASTALYIKGQSLANDIEGSDTTEKIGMVVVAVVIVGLLASVMHKAMPGLFQSIIGTAQEKLQATFGSGEYGT